MSFLRAVVALFMAIFIPISGFIGSLKKDVTELKYTEPEKTEKKVRDDGVFEDPLFRDPRNSDFLIADGSKAIEKIGFETWDYTRAGTLTELELR